MNHDVYLRILLGSLVVSSLAMYGRIYGRQWRGMSWPIRATMGGLALVILYVFGGQFKAVLVQHIAFDLFSVVGLIAFAVVNVGEWFMLKEMRQTGRG